MLFLCLHGAIGSAETFGIQLAPLEKEFEQDDISFRYVNALASMEPPAGFQTYFGVGPYYRWVDGHGEAYEAMLRRVRKLPTGDDPNEVIRRMWYADGAEASTVMVSSWSSVLDYLYKIVDENPEIDGIVGYSEGACVAATFLLDEAVRQRESGRPRRIKCGIFICGWPPMGADRHLLLSDRTDIRIDVPSLHVLGANDPYKDGALALYSMCNKSSAQIFDTGKGHTIPRAGQTMHELGDAVRAMIEPFEQQQQRQQQQQQQHRQ